MLDALSRKLIDKPLHHLAQGIENRMSANAITILGWMVGMLAIPLLAYQAYAWALGVITLNRILDGLDGAVARMQGPTDFGGYLDIVCDFIFYAGIALGFALARQENAVWAALLLFSFMGTASTFLAYAIMAEKRGLNTQIRGRKAFYYLGGLMEGTETILFFTAFCLFPLAFPVLAMVFSLLCGVTTLSRVVLAWAAFGANTE